MKFRIWSLLWVMTLFASALATFGLLIGALAAGIVIGAWKFLLRSQTLYQRVIGIFAVVSLAIWLFLPQGSSLIYRIAAKRNTCSENIKAIGVALRQYHDDKGSFPPAYTIDASGRPIHSWRVLILPYIGESALFERINLKEPWDSPNNAGVAQEMPSLYRCPLYEGAGASSNLESHFYAVLGETTAWSLDQSQKLSDITDSHSETILLIEAAGVSDNWMRTKDLSEEGAINRLTTNPGIGELAYRDFFQETYYISAISGDVLFCDASARHLRPLLDVNAAKALLSISGKESLPRDFSQIPHPQGRTISIWRWRNIASLSAFVVVSLLPLIVPRRLSIGSKP